MRADPPIEYPYEHVKDEDVTRPFRVQSLVQQISESLYELSTKEDGLRALCFCCDPRSILPRMAPTA